MGPISCRRSHGTSSPARSSSARSTMPLTDSVVNSFPHGGPPKATFVNDVPADGLHSWLTTW
jgi:hypothetical protein